MRAFLSAMYSTVAIFGKAAVIYLELFWTVVLGLLTALCLSLSTGGLRSVVKPILVFHVGGLTYLVANRLFKRVRRWLTRVGEAGPEEFPDVEP